MRHRISNLVFGAFGSQALLLHTRSSVSAFSPDKFTFPPLLKSCAKLGDVVKGRILHAQIIKTGFLIDVFTATALVSMYMKVEHAVDALEVLDEMPDRNAATTNAAISGFLQNGYYREAFRMFREVRLSDSGINSVTVASVVGGCDDIVGGIQMHCLAIKLGFEMDLYVGTSLVSMYSRCSEWMMAAKMFEEVPDKSVVTYNAFLTGLLKNRVLHLILDVFNLMKRFSNENPNAVTLITLISANACLLNLELGRQIHGLVLKTEHQFDTMVCTGLVDMYSKCHCWESSYNVFMELHRDHRNLITWNSVISGMMINRKYELAVELFEQLDSQGLEPDSSTWNSMISGFSQSGKAIESFMWFEKMLSEVMVPSLKCVTSLLPACSDLLALKNGKEIHGHVIKALSESDILVSTSLMDMYMKCGFSSWARRIFDQFEPKPKDVIFWNVMISGYGKNGEFESSIEIFDRLCELNVKPSSETFIGVLSSCSHCGEVEKGTHVFRLMHETYGLKPRKEHMGCLIDLLGRNGRLREAKMVMDEVAEALSESGYSSLLGACRQHLDPVLAEEMVRKLGAMERENPAPLVILSGLYAALGRWEDAESVRKEITHRQLIKSPGLTLAGFT